MIKSRLFEILNTQYTIHNVYQIKKKKKRKEKTAPFGVILIRTQVLILYRAAQIYQINRLVAYAPLCSSVPIAVMYQYFAKVL